MLHRQANIIDLAHFLINVRTKTYEIWDVAENRKYSGKILDEATANVEHATVNNIYAATIREESEITATGELETKFRLRHLSVGDEKIAEPES